MAAGLPSPEAQMMSPSTLEGSSGAASSVWRWDLKPWISAPTSSWPPGFLSVLHSGPELTLPGTFPRLPDTLTVNRAPQALGREAPPTWPASPGHCWARPQLHSVPSSLVALLVKALKDLCNLHEPGPSALLCACSLPLSHLVWVQSWS